MNQNELDIWNEGRREITFQRADGKTETIIVKKLGLQGLGKLHALEDPKEECRLFTNGCKGDFESFDDWFADLEENFPEVQLEIWQRGHQVNDPLLQNISSRLEAKEQKRAARRMEILQNLDKMPEAVRAEIGVVMREAAERATTPAQTPGDGN